MHPRGPILNGWEASRRSPAYRASPSQRSGTKDSGSRKLRGEWQAVHGGTATLCAHLEVSIAFSKYMIELQDKFWELERSVYSRFMFCVSLLVPEGQNRLWKIRTVPPGTKWPPTISPSPDGTSRTNEPETGGMILSASSKTAS